MRAVEDALDIEISLNAQYIRNLILIAHALHDHVVHFYQLPALDWVDVTQVLKADPKKASSITESLSDWTDNSEKQMAARQVARGGPAHRTLSSDPLRTAIGAIRP